MFPYSQPKWNYRVDIIVEEIIGHEIVLEVWDYDKNPLLIPEKDDFMGKCHISLDELFDQNGELSMRNQCMPLNNVKVLLEIRNYYLLLILHLYYIAWGRFRAVWVEKIINSPK